MAIQYKDRVADATTTTGTGALTLTGVAPAGFRDFASAGYTSGATVRYCVATADGIAWEVTEGVWTAGNLTRAAVPIASSNAGALVNFAAGTKNITVVMTSRDLQPVAFAAHLTSAQNHPGGNTWFVIKPQNEEYDTHGAYDPTTGLFTAPVAGIYHFDGGTESTGIGGFTAFALVKNGVDYPRRGTTHSSNLVFVWNVSGDLYLAAGDTVAIAHYSELSRAFTVLTTHFNGHLVRPL
ncbi:MAG TPA: hypothetical protein VIL30_16770 [Ramlibacter sp.]|jgi:hypothetical protein